MSNDLAKNFSPFVDVPMLDVVGVGKTHGQRAVRWLRNHCYLASYDPATQTLRAPVTKHGRDHTYEVMHRAIDATDRRGA